jgi:hypothetical protein
LSKRCFDHLDVRPNRIVFHDAEEIRKLQGVGTVLKEQKFVDHRPAVDPNGKVGRGVLTAPPNGHQRGEDTAPYLNGSPSAESKTENLS